MDERELAGLRRPDAVIKIGGSLGRRPAVLRRLMGTIERLAATRTLVVVPGGGGFADQVRDADRRFGLGDSTAHWMAILAMDQYAYLLSELSRKAALARATSEIAAGRVNVLAVSCWLRRADPLPHSWEVTSDSIAAWVAGELQARLLILLKDVDGMFARDPMEKGEPHLQLRADPSRLGGVVDAYFPRALTKGMPCWIINGARPKRLSSVLETGRARGTQVV